VSGLLPEADVRLGKASVEGLGRLLAPFVKTVSAGPRDLVAVKIHPGEAGNSSFVKPSLVAAVVRALELPKGGTFLTDTTVLYSGRRMSAPDCATLAAEHGFRVPDTPPFLVADGLRGDDETVFAAPDGFLTGKAHLARLICDADLMVVISHFKGHLLAGFGGAIKNLGMGCASRAGKLWQHSSVSPVLKADRCTGCGICAVHCPEGAISIRKTALRDAARCTGCGECLGRCPEGAWKVSWDQDMETFNRRMAEYAFCVTRAAKPALYVTFITDVVPDCDCMSDSNPALVEDIGVAVSTDPVALDQACFDQVRQAGVPDGSPLAGRAGSGDEKFTAFRKDADPTLQLSIAESLGVGTRSYSIRGQDTNSAKTC
jgi:uncharacterized Fe-S center protein